MPPRTETEDSSTKHTGNYRFVPLHGKHAGGKSALVDEQDYPLVTTGGKWFLGSVGYAIRTRGRTTMSMHRLILTPADDMTVDHINGNKLDNRRANLRICTPSQNMGNMGARPASSSRYKGVSWSKRDKVWQVKIGNGRRLFHVGQFHDEAEAARAYDRAAREVFGEFARLNFPDETTRQDQLLTPIAVVE